MCVCVCVCVCGGAQSAAPVMSEMRGVIAVSREHPGVMRYYTRNAVVLSCVLLSVGVLVLPVGGAFIVC